MLLVVYFALGLLIGDGFVRLSKGQFIMGPLELISGILAVYHLYFVLGLLT